MPKVPSSYDAIVVGTDGSERAKLAFRQALAIAKLTGAKLHIVHVVHGAIGSEPAGPEAWTLQEMREQDERVRAEAVAGAEQEGVLAELHSPAGDPAEAILQTAETVQASLIVVGNKGMTGARRFVLGSVPNSIAHRSPCDILIVNTDGAEPER